MRLLIAEDDTRIAGFMERGLKEHGYAVDVATDGEETVEWMRMAPFDLLVLDVMLPGKDGFAICQELRSEGFRQPILMLTARDGVQDRVRGLDSGADDYLVKPFAFVELLARLRALLRRDPSLTENTLRVGDLTLNTKTLEVSRSGATLDLTVKECRLLEYLMRHRGQVLTRMMIAEHVWNYDFDNFTNVIDVHIRNLRRKMYDPFGTKMIQTVRGAGYRLDGRVTGED